MPKTSPRTPTGTPRNDCIGGWFAGKPTERRGSSEIRSSRSGRASRISAPSESATTRQVADRLALGASVEPGRDELHQLGPLRVEDPERRVARADDLPRRLHNAHKQVVEVELAAQ